MSNFSIEELRSLIKENLEQSIPSLVEDKGGQGVIPGLEKGTTGKEVTLRVPEFSIDMSWINDTASAVNEQARDRFIKTVNATGLAGDIENLPAFINEINNFTSEVIPAEKYGQAVARILILRTLYNLAKSPDASTMGFSFERFMALMFKGSVIDPAAEGITDVQFPGTNVSLKFLRRGGVVGGSIKKLKEDLKDDPNASVKYIVAEKPGKTDNDIIFHEFVVDQNNIEGLPGYKKGDDEFGTRFSGKISDFKAQGVRQIPGAINLDNVPETSQKMIEDLNQRFNGLIAEVQGLTDEVDSLMLGAGDEGETKKRAAAAKGRAEKSRAAAADIEKTA